MFIRNGIEHGFDNVIDETPTLPIVHQNYLQKQMLIIKSK